MVIRGPFPVLHHQGEEVKDGVLWLREDLKAILPTQDYMVAAKAHFAAPANASLFADMLCMPFVQGAPCVWGPTAQHIAFLF